jgi:hypothetical protein
MRPAWLQQVGDFDVAHPGCHFEVAADCPDLSVQMIEALRVNPTRSFSWFFERKP